MKWKLSLTVKTLLPTKLQAHLQTIQIIRPMERHPRAAGHQAPLVPGLHQVQVINQEVLSLPAACRNPASRLSDDNEIQTMTIARHRKEDNMKLILSRLSATLTLITTIRSMQQS